MSRFYPIAQLKQVVFVACMALLVSCASTPPPTARVEQPHPAWTLSPAEKRKLVQAASTLRAGDSYETVVAALGKPTYDQVGVAKESDRVIGRSLRYYAVRWETGLVNELHDELVHVWLDPQNIVKSVSIRITTTE
jgi:hypothetical protein